MRAMVLCAGYGTRLGSLTRELPKPMLPVCERPMLGYILNHLARQGFGEVAINLHFLPDAIRNYVGDGSGFGLHVRYSHEPVLLGTAGGLKGMAGFLKGDEPFLVQYGDVVTTQDFQDMAAFHRSRGALATMLVHERRGSNSVIKIEADGRVTAMLERPSEAERGLLDSPWVNSGICIAEPELLDLIPDGRSADLPRDIFPLVIRKGRLFAFPLNGYRCAVDSPERLEELESAVREGVVHGLEKG
jgi:NDP-sugar pyrophosphorylase family protein